MVDVPEVGLVYFVPGPDEGRALGAEGVSRGRIWTVAELRQAVGLTAVSRDDARRIAEAKVAFDGRVSGVTDVRAAA